jgi:hypothetical protein
MAAIANRNGRNMVQHVLLPVNIHGVEKIQNGGRSHGNQGAKNVKFSPNSGSF